MNTKRKGLLQKVLMLVLVLCLVCGNGLMALANEAVASSMRLTKTEGTVSVTNKNGRDMGTMADMKLFNGYHLSTEQKSYAWMNLDDHKLIKLDAVSEAEIQKKGKDLEVLLNSGNLLFNVSENLKADETLNIRTSTMVTGIRGTCGWVKVIDSSRTQVYILEGQVQCYVMDPVTGQYKSVVLRSGETAEFVVYDQTRIGDKCDILVNRFSEKNIPGFVAVELMNDSDLSDRVAGSMNLDMNWISGNGLAILNQDQTNAAQKFTAVNEAMKQQDHKVTKDPLFGNEDDGDNGGGGGNGTVTPPDEPTEPDDPTPPTEPTDLTEITLTVAEAEADDQLNFYLSMETMETVTIKPSLDDETLNILATTTVASGQQLILDGVDLAVGDPDLDESVELRINGELNVSGNVVNNGTITNTSLDSFIIGGSLHNVDVAIIENTGKIDAVEGMINDGTIISSGRLIGAVTVSPYGTLELLADDEYGTLEGTLTVQGRPDYNGYVTLYKNMPDELVFDGGTVELAGVEVDTMEISNGSVIVSNGGKIKEVALSSTGVRNGVLTVDAGGSVGNVVADGGVLDVNGGMLNAVTMDAGDFRMTSGTVKSVTASPGASLNVSGGDIETINLGGAFYTDAGNNITIDAAKGTLAVMDGVIVSATLERFYEEDSDDFVEAVASITDTNGVIEEWKQFNGQLLMRGGSIGNLYMENGLLTIDRTASVNDVELVDSNIYFKNGTVGSLSLSGNHSSFDLNTGVYSYMSGGTVTNGMAILGTDTKIDISGGTIENRDTEAALLIDVRSLNLTDENVQNVFLTSCIIDGKDGKAIVLRTGKAYMNLPDPNADTVNWPTIRSNDPRNLIESVYNGADVSTYTEFSYGGEEAITDFTYVNYTQVDNQAVLSSVYPNLGNALSMAAAGETVLVHDNDGFGEGEYVEVFGGTKSAPVVLDLNGQDLSTNNIWNIGYADDETFVETPATLVICDSVGGGSLYIKHLTVTESSDLTIDGVELVLVEPEENDIERAGLYNNGTLTLNDVSATANAIIENNGTMTIKDGVYKANTTGVLNYADLTLNGNIEFECSSGYGEEASAMIEQIGGSITIQESEISCDLIDEYSQFLSMDPTYEADSMVYATAKIKDSIIDAGEAMVLSVVDGTIVNVDNSTLTSESYNGTISYFHNANREETILLLNTGIIENTGLAAAISIDAPMAIDLPLVYPFNIGATGMVIRSNGAYPIDYYSDDGKTEPYLANYGYMIQPDNSGEWHNIVKNTQSSAVTLGLRDTSNSGTEPEEEETATASNATPSNASGTPTSSKSAIPMAVAMLAGLMAVAPKLFEDSENKKRKER